jgi:hypothetical protein
MGLGAWFGHMVSLTQVFTLVTSGQRTCRTEVASIYFSVGKSTLLPAMRRTCFQCCAAMSARHEENDFFPGIKNTK